MGARCWWSMAVLGLAGCAGRPEPVAVAPPPATAPPALPAPTPINAGLSPAATLWHLRSGLNVAALACRGPEEALTIARYNAWLAAHAAALASAQARHEAEYAAAGGDWRDRYDDDQTRLYNFFGQPRGREALCAAARAALAEPTLEETALAASAPGQLATLDRALAPPRLEVDARTFTGPGPVMVALR